MLILDIGILDLTFNNIINFLAVAIVLWVIIKNILEVKKTAKEQMIREQGWDYAATKIKEKEEKWDTGLADVYNERNKIVERYDDRLDSLDEKLNNSYTLLQDKIDENHTETEAKMQELQTIVIMIIKSLNAVLEGQIEQGCNGEVRKQHAELNNFITEQIGR